MAWVRLLSVWVNYFPENDRSGGEFLMGWLLNAGVQCHLGIGDRVTQGFQLPQMAALLFNDSV